MNEEAAVNRTGWTLVNNDNNVANVKKGTMYSSSAEKQC